MARRKITDVAQLDASDLPDLTEQQMEFVRNLLAGKTASDAYRAAYNTANMSDRTLWAEASKLNTHPGVAQWLAAARQACLGTAVVTKEAHLHQLERIREIALKSGNIGAAVAAEQTRGKVAGHHIERVQDVTPVSPHDTLRDIAQIDPALAHALAKQHGIEFDSEQHDGATKH